MPGSALIRALAARLSAPDPVGSRLGYRAAALGGRVARGAEARSQRRLGLPDDKRLLDAEHRGRKAGMAAGDRVAGAAHRYGPLAVAAGAGALTAAQIKQRRDAAKSGAEKRRAGAPAEKAAPSADLAKSWQSRLPAVLDAIHAAHAMRAAGGHEPAMLDSQAVTRLVGRVARLARERGAVAAPMAAPMAPKKAPPFGAGRDKGKAKPGADEDMPPRGAEAEGDEAETPRKKGKGKPPPFAKAASPGGEILTKSAPLELRKAWAGLTPAEQATFAAGHDPFVARLAAFDAELRATPIAERHALAKAWVDGLDEKDRELAKFWGLAARGAMAAAPMVGRLAGATARGIGMLGPKLSRLFGIGRPAAAAAADRQAGAAAAAGTHIPPIPGAPGAARPSMGYRAMRAGRAAAGYGARAAAGLGRHAYANRGSYGLTAGYEVGRRWGAED